jgi:hypothetical protein
VAGPPTGSRWAECRPQRGPLRILDDGTRDRSAAIRILFTSWVSPTGPLPAGILRLGSVVDQAKVELEFIEHVFYTY